jgi:uncharacterized protein (DUF433 family)
MTMHWLRVGGWEDKPDSFKELENHDNPGVVIRAGMGFITCMKKNAVVVVDPEIMSGEPCFVGSRVPVRALLDYFEGGDTLDQFLEQYPTVSRTQAVAFLEQASQRLLASA